MDVTLPDGTVISGVPDGMSKADLTNKLIANGMAKSLGGIQPNPTEGMSGIQKFLAGAGAGLSSIPQGIGQRLGIIPQSSVDQTIQQNAPLMKTGAGMAGNVTGMAAPFMLAPEMGIAGTAALGAGAGAAMPTATGESPALNAGLGALGGLAGKGIGALASNIVKPVAGNPAGRQAIIDSAKDLGLNIPLGIATGSKNLKGIDEAFKALPLTSGRMADIAAQNQSTINKISASAIGSITDELTPTVLSDASKRIGNVFTDVAKRTTQIPLGDNLLNTLVGIESKLTPFSPPQIKGAIGKALDLAAKGSITGEEQQSIRSSLTSAADSAYRARGGSELGGALKTIRNAFDDALYQAAPAADSKALQDARTQWAALKVIQKSVTPEGNVSPLKLAGAIKTGNRALYTQGGGGPLADLGRIGETLKVDIPNSGTPERTMWQNLLTSGSPLAIAGGAAGAYQGGTPESAAEGGAAGLALSLLGPRALQSMMYSRIGQAYLKNGLLGGAEVPALLRAAAARGGAVTAPALLNPAQ